jgi:phosphoenolpyruvate carboxykinase (ATP)
VRGTWRDRARYDEQARELARRFDDNFAAYRACVSEAVAAAGPLSARAA